MLILKIVHDNLVFFSEKKIKTNDKISNFVIWENRGCSNFASSKYAVISERKIQSLETIQISGKYPNYISQKSKKRISKHIFMITKTF